MHGIFAEYLFVKMWEFWQPSLNSIYLKSNSTYPRSNSSYPGSNSSLIFLIKISRIRSWISRIWLKINRIQTRLPKFSHFDKKIFSKNTVHYDRIICLKINESISAVIWLCQIRLFTDSCLPAISISSILLFAVHNYE